MALSLVTPPTGEPVTLEEALDHVRLPQDAPDSAVVEALITAAREYVEIQTGRQLLTASYSLTLDHFPHWRVPVSLPMPPLQDVTAITYLDAAGATQTWAAGQYVVDAPAGPRCLEGRFYPALDCDYPDTAARRDAVTVAFDAGYGTAADVPQAIKQALLLLVGHYYENREASVVGAGSFTVATLPMAVDALLAPFLLFSGALR